MKTWMILEVAALVLTASVGIAATGTIDGHWVSNTCTTHTNHDSTPKGCSINIHIYDRKSDRVTISFPGMVTTFYFFNGQFYSPPWGASGTISDTAIDLSFDGNMVPGPRSHLQLTLTTPDTAHVEWTSADTYSDYGSWPHTLYIYSADMRWYPL